MTPTQAAVDATVALAEAIRSLGTVPSGHLYARVMSSMNIQTYTAIITVLKNAELVAERNHELTWIGPKFDEVGS